MAVLTTSYQKIAEEVIGRVEDTGVALKYVSLRIYAKYTSQDIATNKTYVSYKSTLYVDGSGTYFYTGNTTTKSLSGSGVSTKSGDAQGNYYLGETTLYESTGVVTHGSLGEASISVTAGWKSTPWYINGSLTGTATLPTIARSTKPTFSATTVTLGNSINVTLSPSNSTFKHRLWYWIANSGNLESGFSTAGSFTAQGNTTVTFTPPTSLGAYMPTAMSSTCTVLCLTYSADDVYMGSTESNITLNVPSYTPEINSVSLTGNNLLNGAYVKGKSTVTGNATLKTYYGATVKSVVAKVDGKDYTSLPFTSDILTNGSKTVAITFTDSRDKSVTYTSSAFTVYDYSPPQITDFTLERQSDGTTVIATVKGSIAAVNNKNTKTVKVLLDGKEKTITANSYTVNETITFTGVNTDATLTATATFTDSYSSVSKDSVLPTVAVTMDFWKDGNGIAMGKVAEQGDLLDVAWEIKTGKPEKTLNNFSYRGTNLISKNADDTIQNWSNQGNLATTFYTDSATGITKPSTWGFLVNVTTGPNTTEAHQLWFEQSNGNVLHRGGNSSGFGEWKTLIDNSNFGSNFSSSLNATIKDYVVEQGTSGIWTYRKWNSGIAECWGIYTMASSCTLAWGSLYYSNKTCSRINYPFTFTIRPQETVSLRLDAYSAWPYADSEGKGMNTTTQTAVYGFLRPSSMGETTIRYEFTVIGRWK